MQAVALLQTAEKQLAETEFVAGPAISAADAMVREDLLCQNCGDPLRCLVIQHLSFRVLGCVNLEPQRPETPCNGGFDWTEGLVKLCPDGVIQSAINPGRPSLPSAASSLQRDDLLLRGIGTPGLLPFLFIVQNRCRVLFYLFFLGSFSTFSSLVLPHLNRQGWSYSLELVILVPLGL